MGEGLCLHDCCPQGDELAASERLGAGESAATTPHDVKQLTAALGMSDAWAAHYR
ncbi:hypothetical protein GCM10010493_35420 [Streptomyces lavendulae subsp. grasserius]